MDTPIYIYKTPNTATPEYIWKSYTGTGIGYDTIENQDPRQFDILKPANLTLYEQMTWINALDDEMYEKHHKEFMRYKQSSCTDLRKIIGEWNDKRPTADKIKGISKMKLDELVRIAEGGKYQ